MVVAIALALIVPTAQLRTVAEQPTCCCPDPSTCKCHDHNGDPSTQSKMRACHTQPEELVQTELAAFVAPAGDVITAPVRPTVIANAIIDDPHPAPPARRPDVPS